MSLDATDKPILFLLDREFEDGQIPGQRFFCRHSLLLEGALSSIDGLDARLDVRRIGLRTAAPGGDRRDRRAGPVAAEAGAAAGRAQ
ncbi:MAG: DUF3088 family protein [Stenotrophomonas maltophilia]